MHLQIFDNSLYLFLFFIEQGDFHTAASSFPVQSTFSFFSPPHCMQLFGGDDFSAEKKVSFQAAETESDSGSERKNGSLRKHCRTHTDR